MGGRGPAPRSDQSTRVRPRKEQRHTIAPAPDVVAPPLPGGPWRAEVVRWYDVWATSPQASRFTATDWQRLHMLAPMVEAYWEEPNVRVLGEIRLNESLLGATEADRSRLRWDFTKKAAPAPVASAAERRERIKLA